MDWVQRFNVLIPTFTIAPVTYYAPEAEEAYTDQAAFGSLFIKRATDFRHENELRALAYRTNLGTGIDISVKAEVLIDHLFLSPELPRWAVSETCALGMSDGDNERFHYFNAAEVKT